MNVKFLTSMMERALIPAAFSWAYGDPNILKNFAYNTTAIQSFHALSRAVEKAVERTFPSSDQRWKVGAGFAVAAPVVWTVAKQCDHQLSYFFWGILALNSFARTLPSPPVQPQPVYAKL
ncbi:MAG: hypothetical protein P0S96_05785 [Simkaniaceae bacterium]|nr:hypothetical protein [Candidatus Sacchlamyda saccharinae]